MRLLFAVVVAVLVAAGALAQAEKTPTPSTRYGVEADLETYPQASAQETLASVIKAVEDKRIDYLLAQLADPAFVDQRVKETGGGFKDLLKEATAKLLDDPQAVRQLRRFLKESDWQLKDDSAAVRLKDAPDRVVHLRKQGERWFLENRVQPDAEPK